MKRILSFYYTKLFVFCQVLMLTLALFTPVFANSANAASANNFYFKDATFNYYLEPTADGNKMHVEETLTAVFPETNQNHGITRSIPYTNQGGKNLTAVNSAALNFKATRNGATEEIAKTDKENGHYIFYLGNKNAYVHGEQTYVLDYDFTNVVTEFDDFQEIYWDTNGTGWSQKFEKLTANLILPDDIADKVINNKTSCYVGRYGESGSNRCHISKSENIITFTTTNVSAGENLTFAVDFEPNTFVVPEPSKNYILVITTAIVAALSLLIIFFKIRSYRKNVHPNKVYYKGLFTAPQYEPPKDYCVAEASELYMGKKEKTYVGTLLELAVSKKISIVKGEPTKMLKKDTWKIQINNLDNITDSQEDLLRILNGGSKVHAGEEIPVEKHTATSTLASLSRSYSADAIAKLKRLKLLGEKATLSTPVGVSFIITAIVFVVCFGLPILMAFDSTFLKDLFGMSYGTVVGKDFLPGVIFAIIVLTIIVSAYFSHLNKKYGQYTTTGLDQANYLDGLYLYINMAEKDRLKFLQSVKGADTSKEGIVHLYERLLPYACLFGVEESWAKELGRYCEEINYNPDWYSGGDLASFYLISSMVNTVNSTVASSTSYTSSSSGSSSGFSGGGGGGFSGGGGGGGGGGGW